jgi:hypothetical protein
MPAEASLGKNRPRYPRVPASAVPDKLSSQESVDDSNEVPRRSAILMPQRELWR